MANPTAENKLCNRCGGVLTSFERGSRLCVNCEDESHASKPMNCTQAFEEWWRPHWGNLGAKRPNEGESFRAGWNAAMRAHETPAVGVDTERLNWIERECAELRCKEERGFDDADVYYEVWKFYMSPPRERPVGLGTGPREALDAAMANDDDECCYCGQERNCGVCSPVETVAVQRDRDAPIYQCPDSDSGYSDAWDEVAKALRAHNPKLFEPQASGLNCALMEIRRLQALDMPAVETSLGNLDRSGRRLIDEPGHDRTNAGSIPAPGSTKTDSSARQVTCKDCGYTYEPRVFLVHVCPTFKSLAHEDGKICDPARRCPLCLGKPLLDPNRPKCACGMYAPEPGYPCGCCGRIGPEKAPGGCMACGGLGYIDEPGNPCDCTALKAGPVEKGHFWRGDVDPDICKNCERSYFEHERTDKGNACPTEKASELQCDAMSPGSVWTSKQCDKVRGHVGPHVATRYGVTDKWTSENGRAE